MSGARVAPADRSATSGGTVSVAVTVLTWACAFPAIHVGLEGFGPVALGLGRLAIASIVLAGAALWWRPARPPRRLWGRVLLSGVIGQALYQLLLMVGERHVPAGTASILIATAPLFSVIAAAVLIAEPIRPRQWPGTMLALSGTVLVGVSLGLGGGIDVLAIIAAAACQGLYHVIVKPLSQAIGAFAATAWSVWAGAVVTLPVLPWLLHDLRSASTGAITATMFLGLVPSALGYFTWSIALARAPIAQTTSALYLVPVVALGVSWAWLGERPAILAVLGGAIAIAGVLIVRTGAPHPATRRTSPADEPESSGRDLTTTVDGAS